MKAEVICDLAGLHALQTEWDRLWAEDATADIFGSFDWFLNWWTHFGQGERTDALHAHGASGLIAVPGGNWRMRVIVVRDPAGVTRAILPLVLISGMYEGVRCRILSTPINSQSVRACIVASPFGPDIVTVLCDALCEESEWDVLLLTGVARDGARPKQLAAALAGRGMTRGPVGTVPSAYLRIDGTWDEYMAGGSRRHFRRSLVKAERGLEKSGALSWERYAAAEASSIGTTLFMEVDGASWKAHSGESVAMVPALRDYYTALCARLAQTGRAEVWGLRVGGQPAAVFLCLNDGRALYTLKSSYSEAFAEGRSPSQVLIRHVIRESWNSGLRGVDFVGKVPFLDRWANEDLQVWYASVCRSKVLAARIAGYRFLNRLRALPDRVRRRLRDPMMRRP